MKIYIDPGHGGESIGAAYNGRKEQDDVLRLALKVRDLLLEQKNIEVKLSREGNIDPDLMDRAREANAWGADYFCSIHRNAVAPNKAKGAEVWCYSEIEIEGDTYKKAEKILNELCKATGFVNRGVKLGAPSYKDYAVNRYTNMSSCLLEVGFIDSDVDNEIFDRTFDEMAMSIAIGLMEAVGVEYKNPAIKGDVNGDGKISAVDAREILRTSVGLDNADVDVADVNGDGKVTAADARLTLRESVGLNDTSLKMGDVDGDGKITVADARLVLRASVGLETLTEEQTKVADMNQDGKISAVDAKEITNKSVGL